MARKPRIKYTEELKAEIWRKYKQDKSLWSLDELVNAGSATSWTKYRLAGWLPNVPRVGLWAVGVGKRSVVWRKRLHAGE